MAMMVNSVCHCSRGSIGSTSTFRVSTLHIDAAI
jgi:hypothetical protein